jgi:hypothetical protein
MAELRTALEDARASVRRLEQQSLALTTIVSQMQHQQQMQQLQMQQAPQSLSAHSDILVPASAAAQDSLNNQVGLALCLCDAKLCTGTHPAAAIRS